MATKYAGDGGESIMEEVQSLVVLEKFLGVDQATDYWKLAGVDKKMD